MFENATIKLTLLYLAIIMAISLFFSFNLYHLSVDELVWGYQRQNSLIRNLPGFGPLLDQEDLSDNRAVVLREGQNRIILRLAYINLIILGTGGFVSYVLARKTLQPIEESHKAQSRFAADASHELRTPLTAMQTEIEVALRDSTFSAKDARELLRSNLEELAKLTKLSDGLLRLTSLSSETLPRSRIKVNKLLQSAIDQVGSQTEAKKIVIRLTSPKNLSINGDLQSLTELLVILLENAIKYSPGNSVIRVVGTDSGNQQIAISITDEGLGIGAHDIKHIFERFYRADAARTKSKTAGYGLGLSIAKNIVDLHKGKIDVVSTPNQGSTFTVTLPIT